jgi:hypothetical protein
MPVADSVSVFDFALLAGGGTIFSFSGSWKVTDFLVIAVPILDVGLEMLDFKPGVGLVVGSVQTVPAAFAALDAGRPRVAFLTGSGAVDVLSSSI